MEMLLNHARQRRLEYLKAAVLVRTKARKGICQAGVHGRRLPDREEGFRDNWNTFHCLRVLALSLDLNERYLSRHFASFSQSPSGHAPVCMVMIIRIRSSA